MLNVECRMLNVIKDFKARPAVRANSAIGNQQSAISRSITEAFHVSDGESQIRFALELVLFEGERQVDAGAVLVEELGALDGAPGDGAEAPPILREGHLEVSLFERPGSIHDLDT